MDVRVRLGEWTEHCAPPAAAAGLPRFWATLTDEPRAGWGSVAFHWTGARWATCVPLDWEAGQLPPAATLVAWTAAARQTVSAIPYQRLRDEYRTGLADSLRRTRASIESEEERTTALRVQVRQLECASAAAGLRDPEVSAVAHRLWGDWVGSADDLLEVAHALVAAPDR